jgi:hypothetical protein
MHYRAILHRLAEFSFTLPAYETRPLTRFGEKPPDGLDSVQAILNCRREKRLLYALDRCTSQKVSSNKKQTCQEWNLDLHDASPQFPSSRLNRVARRVPAFIDY